MKIVPIISIFIVSMLNSSSVTKFPEIVGSQGYIAAKEAHVNAIVDHYWFSKKEVSLF